MAIVELLLCKDFAATGTLEYSADSDAGPWTAVTLTSTAPVREALADWASQISTAISPEVATFTYADGIVTLECTDIVWFRMSACLAELLGFADVVQEAGNTSDQTPLGIADLLVGQSFPFDVEEGEIREYRAARASAYHFGRTVEVQVVLGFSAAQWTAFSDTPNEWGEGVVSGPLLVGPTALASGHGAFKVTLTNEDDWGEDDLDGALTLYPVETLNLEQDGPEEWVHVTLRCTMTDPGVAVPATADTAWARLWGATRYAYAPQYILVAEGIPKIPCEYVGDAVAPDGYELDASLVIDHSSRPGVVIDPRSHFSSGFDLEVRLLDTPVVRALMTRPTRFATLWEDVDFDETDWEVRDRIGDWTGSNSLYIGTSLETKTTDGVVTFGGITRGAYGRQRSYRAGTIIADNVYEWKGRHVSLYVALRDPSGRYVQTANVLDQAIVLWSGYTQERPERDGTEWVIPCRDQVRRLTQPLGVAASGRALWNIDDDGMVPVDVDAVLGFNLYLDGTLKENLNVRPFVGQPAVLRRSQVRALVVTALEAGFTSGVVHDLEWRRAGGPNLPPNLFDVFHLWAAVDVASTDSQIRGGASVVSTAAMRPVLQGGSFETNTLDSTTTLQAFIGFTNPTTVGGLTLSVVLDEGDPAAIPEAGWVVIEGNGRTAYKRYTSFAVDDSDPSQINLILDPSTPFSPDEITAVTDDPNGVIGAVSDIGVKFFWRDSGLVPDILRAAIASTGDGVNGSYDTLAKGQGLGLPDVDEDSFDNVFDGFFRDMPAAIGTEAGTSLQEVFSGLLRLSQRALTARRAVDGSAVNIAAVHIGSVDGVPVATITDATLVAVAGKRPARPVMVFAAPQAIGIKCRTLPIDDAPAGEGPITLKDPHLVDWTSDAWDLDVYGFSRSAVLGPAKVWALAWFRAGENRQVIELDVPPWIDAQAGDVVELDLDDPNLWDYATGTPGVHSLARVLGAQFSLTSSVQTLTLAVDGILSAGPMCPSLECVEIVSPAAFYRSDGASGSYADASTNVAARVLFNGATTGPWSQTRWIRSGDWGSPGLGGLIGDAGDSNPGLFLYYDGNFEADIFTNSGYLGTCSGTISPSNDVWILLSYVCDGTDVRAYENDSLVGSVPVTLSGTFAAADDAIMIGDVVGPPHDERAYGFWSRALSPTEIADLYAAGPSHDLTVATGAYTPDPVVLWDQPDVAGVVANRGSGGTCNLVFHGGVTSETL